MLPYKGNDEYELGEHNAGLKYPRSRENYVDVPKPSTRCEDSLIGIAVQPWKGSPWNPERHEQIGT